MSKPLDDKVQFRIEFILAFIITGLACAAGFSNLLFMPNDLFPLTSDAMGHMVKVRFLAESFTRGEFPSWFPYWYNGTAVTQYYPPLSYWIMAPIFTLTKNAMLTFKLYCFIMNFIGGIGAWYFCRTNIGRWCGLFGAVIFCLQPFNLEVLLSAGMVAQGPIIALISWYLVAFLAFGKKPCARNFLTSTSLSALIILSHANTAFMICFCIMAIAFIFVLLKKIAFATYLFMIFSLIFAGILTAFWSLIGVTGLENQNLPYFLPEAPLVYTADWSWFLSLSSEYFFYAIPVTIGCIIATLVFAYRTSIKKTEKNENFNIFFCIMLTALTMIFSFGLRLPLFEYLPMAESFYAGRILTLTSATGAILCAYLINRIHQSVKDKKVSIRILASILNISVMVSILFYMNPLKTEYTALSDNNFDKLISKNNKTAVSNFDKGRYTYVGGYDCSETYFAVLRNYNVTEGWNIEGTQHHQTYRNYMIAIPTENYSYIARNIAFWNVRTVLATEKYDKLMEVLNENYSFELAVARKDGNFYTSDDPSSYFLIDKRNALVLGAGSPGVSIEFPYLVYGISDNISDYSLEELEKYKLIYLCEPTVDSLSEKKEIESIIEKLVGKGITVIIEPAIPKGYSIFDVTASDVKLEDSPVMKEQNDLLINSTLTAIEVDGRMNYARVLFGLDKVYYELIQNNNRLKNDIIGAKNVSNGEVLYIGMHLSQYLKAVYTRSFGVATNNAYTESTDEIKSLFEAIFDTYGVNKDFWPDQFPVENADWNYKGVNFEYSSQKTQEMTLSVTYTPRWKATLDGKPIAVGQKENLITLDLPEGNHKVQLIYGITKYGVAGYVISLAGLLIFLLFIKYYDIIFINFRQICVKFSKFLQLNNNED